MLKAIKEYFSGQIDPGDNRCDLEESNHKLKLASAALLIEVSRADFEISEVEESAISEGLIKCFELSEKETSDLLALAHAEVKQSASLFDFTTLIDKNFDQDKKTKIVELLWQVVFADGVMDKHEEYLVRKVAELIHVPHSVFLQTKHKIEEIQI